MDFEYQLICAMQESDLHISSINLATGIYHRFKSEGTCKKKCCEYRIFENLLGAHFKCFRRGIDRFWFARKDGLITNHDKKILYNERARLNEERKNNQQRLANKCARFYSRCSTSAEKLFKHPYSYRKLIKPYASRIARRMLVLPVCDINRQIKTLQFIKTNGFKQFKSGASANHGMVWLCPPLTHDYEDTIRLCEGWSTGCTIRQITDDPVVCAMNAYNLTNVGNALRKKYPSAKIIVCSDNDQWKEENTGLKNAIMAARIANASICFPDFRGLNCKTLPTDFNDLFLLAGKDVAARQLTITNGDF